MSEQADLRSAYNDPPLTPLEAEVLSLRHEVERLRESAMEAWTARDEAVMRCQELDLDLSDAQVNIREMRPAYEGEITAMRGVITALEAERDAYKAERDTLLEIARAAQAWRATWAILDDAAAAVERRQKARRRLFAALDTWAMGDGER